MPDDEGGGVRLRPVEVRAAANRNAQLPVGVSRQDASFNRSRNSTMLRAYLNLIQA